MWTALHGRYDVFRFDAGAYRADKLEAGSAGVEKFVPELTASRTKPLEPFREAARAVDLTAAGIIVSVGRGIKEADKLPIAEDVSGGGNFGGDPGGNNLCVS